jgi:hypothetical protein
MRRSETRRYRNERAARGDRAGFYFVEIVGGEVENSCGTRSIHLT